MKWIVVFLMVLSCEAATFDQFCAALAKVESSGNPKAYNVKEKAIGLYQIRPAYFKDAQEYDKDLARFSHRDCYNPQVAKRVVWAYLSRYGAKDVESMARLHNAGPAWGSKMRATDGYWQKIKKNLTSNP